MSTEQWCWSGVSVPTQGGLTAFVYSPTGTLALWGK